MLKSFIHSYTATKKNWVWIFSLARNYKNMITTSYEGKRGCGFRKPGGLYLVSGLNFGACGKLPLPLTVCTCCGAGIKPARGWTWISDDLIKDRHCITETCTTGCVPFDGSVKKFGLIWIGEKFYPTPEAFMKEGVAHGISRRINSIPREFKLGETWVLLAHHKAINSVLMDEPDPIPGIFTAFKPERIEYIVKGDETEEEIERMEKRGITLIKVVPRAEQQEITHHNEQRKITGVKGWIKSLWK